MSGKLRLRTEVSKLLGDRLAERFEISARQAAGSGAPTFGLSYKTVRGSRIFADGEIPLREIREELVRVREANSLAGALGYLAEQARELTRPLGFEPPLGPAEGYEWCPWCKGLRRGRVVVVDDGFVLAPSGEPTHGFLAELCFCWEAELRLELVEPRFGVMLDRRAWDPNPSRQVVVRFDGDYYWLARDGSRSTYWPERPEVELGRFPSWAAAEAAWVRR